MTTVSKLLKLSAGALELVVAPAVGASIARLDYVTENGRVPVLRGPEGELSSPLEAGNFPLIPYSNRIREGRFSFRGREVTIARNMESDASPLHGDGWLAPWEVVSAAESTAELVYRHEPGEWPWRYEARQLFELDERGLSLRLSCRNLSEEPMPCGLGQHPYFHCTAETRLDTEVTDAWTIDEKVLPVDKVPATGRYDLADRLICGQDLDNGFGGWSGIARLETPGLPFRIEITSPDARFFQVYSPASGGIVVAEPVSHANAALNESEERWGELGLRVLEPGEEMSLSARIGVHPV
ncbi:MAG TPA: aldose 1-epimerase [Allosphingosinicella sp.]|jgi:aldose 1-epimerase